jgi:hypothetical protein
MSHRTHPSALAAPVYRALLRAYPPTFRRRYAPSMLSDFQDAYRAAQTHPLRLARLWFDLVGDIAISALLERMKAMKGLHWLRWVVAIALGLGVGAFDYSVSEVQSTLIVLLPLTFIFGFVNAKGAWRWALIIGLGIPVAHVIGHALNIQPPYQDNVVASGLALIPTAIGVYSGALARRILTPSPQRVA